MTQEVITQYADRVFSYVVCMWLLYERRDVTNGLKESFGQLKEVIDKLTVVIQERIK